MESLSIIKIGGSILENDIELDNFLKNFAMIEGKKILVHGGGKEGDKWLKKMHIKLDGISISQRHLCSFV